jgi:hypothetical protein
MRSSSSSAAVPQSQLVADELFVFLLLEPVTLGSGQIKTACKVFFLIQSSKGQGAW